MALTLHHLNFSRSERIIWLLEELGVSYQLKRYSRDVQTRLAPPELLDIHPMGKAPLLDHDGMILSESGAIALHLLEEFDLDHRLHPAPKAANRAVFLEWVHASEGAVFLPFLMNTYLTGTGLGDTVLAQLMAGERVKAVSTLEQHLGENPYFAGPAFTAADIMMGFQLEALDARGGVNDGSAITAWLGRVRAREGYQAMRKVTGED